MEIQIRVKCGIGEFISTLNRCHIEPPIPVWNLEVRTVIPGCIWYIGVTSLVV